MSKCIWDIQGIECNGKIDYEMVRIGEFEVEFPMCRNHKKQHTKIMKLVSRGYEIEQIMQWADEDKLDEILGE